jgi:Alpha/beta hydrolase family
MTKTTTIDPKFIDQLLEQTAPEDLLGENGLIFWAAYCDKSFDLSSRTDVQVTSISGSLDGLATPVKIESTKAFAPSSTKYVVINGGNHAQFGNYGVQSGDNPARISLEDQQKQVVGATISALKDL